MVKAIILVCFFSLLGVLSSMSFPYESPLSFWLDTIGKDTIEIEEIKIEKALPTLEEKFEQKKTDYRTIYLLGDNKKPFFISRTGIGANLNKIYNHFSKSGIKARKLQRFFENEYEDDSMNEIWKPYSVEFSGLKSDSLQDFQIYYKPTFSWIVQASHYDRIYYIKTKLKNYLDSVEAIRSKLRLAK